MNVVVYVEGDSDRLALEALLTAESERLAAVGVAIRLISAPPGDAKKFVLLEVPRRAARILANDASAHVVALPDLFPRNKGFPHATCAEIEAEQRRRLERLLVEQRQDVRAAQRFRTFCLKHDLEALVLAAEEALAARLGRPLETLRGRWRRPVEDQDHECPPKRVVEELFRECGLSYQASVDAPLILRDAALATIVERCPQCFGPFVDWLRSLA